MKSHSELSPWHCCVLMRHSQEDSHTGMPNGAYQQPNGTWKTFEPPVQKVSRSRTPEQFTPPPDRRSRCQGNT